MHSLKTGETASHTPLSPLFIPQMVPVRPGARLLFIYQCNLYPFPHRRCDLYHKIQRRIVAAALEAGDIRLGNPRLSAKLRLCHAV